MNVKGAKLAFMGKPQIYFANMGHGEAIAFEVNGQWYLRDFGEYTSKVSGLRCSVAKLLEDSDTSKCIFKDLTKSQGDKRWNAILSHAHCDHFSGFEELFDKAIKQERLPEKIFKNAYLPLVCKGNKDYLNYSCLIEGNVLLASFFKQKEKKGNAYTFLKSDIIMAALSDNIIYCSSETPPPAPFNAVYCPIKSISSDAYAELFDIQRMLDDFYERYFQNENERAAIKSNVQKIQKILEKYHWHGEKSILNVSFEDAKKDIDAIDDAISNVKKYTKNDFKWGKLPQYIKNILDDCSLVFDVHLTDESKWLFLGDNNDPILRAALPRNIQYNGIKTSHHGTRGGQVLKQKNITANTLIACVSREHEKFCAIEKEYCDKGIIALGIPPEKDEFEKKGGIIKNVPCLKYPDKDSNTCCSEPGFPKEEKNCMKGLPCIKCKIQQ